MTQGEDKNYLLDSMKFPEKLWNLISNCRSGAISWSLSGDSIIIEYSKFKAEFLCGETVIFKTSNVASFIRQLNLYGFRKCHRLSEEGHEFRHPFFIRDRKDLLSFMCRKPTPLRIVPPINKNKIFKKSLYKKLSSQKMTLNDSEIQDIFKEGTNMQLRKPLSYIENHNEDNRRHLLWNNFAVAPYPQFSNNVNSWLSANPSFYNFSKPGKENTNETDTNKKDVFNSSQLTDGYSRFLNPGNMYFLVVPGYAPQQNPYMFQNQAFSNGMGPIPGVPFSFPPDAKVSDLFSKETNTQGNKEEKPSP